MFEQLGKRAVVLCTTPFEVTSKNIARVLGLPEFPFVLLPHPLGSNTAEEIEARAEIATEASAEILMG